MIRMLSFLLFWMRRRRAGGFGVVGGLVALSLVGNAVTFYLFDKPLKPDLTWSDAFWYSIVSITTVGYGDFSATTPGARIGTVVFIMFLGLAAFTLFLGNLTEVFMDNMQKSRRGLATLELSNHIIIINFPGMLRVQHLIRELRADPTYKKQPIVLLNDQLEELPFTEADVHFVNGPPLDAEVLDRACIKTAQKVLILSRAYDDPNSDAVSASIALVVEQINPDIFSVVECQEDRYRKLFRATRCNSIVVGPTVSANLLVQELQDPGVSRMLEFLTSNQQGATLYSTKLSQDGEISYLEVASRLLQQGGSLSCVHRAGASITDFRNVTPQKGDEVIYIAEKRVGSDTILGRG